MHDIKSIVIPNIDYDFPVKLNIYYNNVKEECSKWMLNYNLFENNNKLISMVNDFVLLTSLAHPYATYEQLCALSKHFIWIFIIDDVAENFNKDTRKIVELYNDIIKITNGENINVDKFNIYSKIFYNLWNSLDLNSILKKRFYKRFKDYVDGLIEESKSINNYMSMNKFYYNRKKTSESHVVAVLIEYGMNIVLNDNIANNKYINDLNMHFIDITFIINDIYSFKKEFNDSYFMNFVYIIYKESNCSIEESINKSIVILNEKILEFKKIEHIITNKNNNDNVNTYIKGLKYWISGFLLWSKISPRYSI